MIFELQLIFINFKQINNEKTNIRLIIFLTLIQVNNVSSQWTVKFDNISNVPWMGNWHIGLEDVFVKYQYNSTSDQILARNYSNGWAATIIDGSTSSNQWPYIYWNNSQGLGTIDSVWDIRNGDLIYSLRNTSNTCLFFCISPVNYYDTRILYYSGGGIFNESFHTFGYYGNENGTIYNYPGGWIRHHDDKYVIGNFDGDSEGNEQLLLVCNSTNWASLFKITSTINWNTLWSNLGNGFISGWDVNSNDIFLSANVDGGPEDELICTNNTTHYCTIYKLQNSTWNVVWSNNGSNNIGGWNMSSTTKYVTGGDFNNDKKTDILFVDNNTHYATIKNFQNQTFWPDLYSNIGSGGLNTWSIGSYDKYYILNSKDLFSINTTTGKTNLQQFDSPKPPCILNVKVFMEGFYRSVNTLISDTISVHLREATAPYTEVEVKKALPGINNIFSLQFTEAEFEQDYYIEVTHRNSIETWSAQPIKFHSINTTSYDFISSNASAYGSNEVQVETNPLKFAIYSGDVNQDGTVDISDVIQVNTALTNQITGYVPEDVNGDNIVDVSDLVITFNNSNNYVTTIKP